MYELYYIPLTKNDGDMAKDKLLCRVSPQRQKSSSLPSLLGEAFARYLACNSSGLQNEMLRIERNPYGKPYFENLPAFCYSISHTEGAVLIGVSDHEIGVDIEKPRRIHPRIPERFFLPQERDYVYLEDTGCEERFFEIWTRKEAYIKWLGKGLAIPLSSFDTLSEKLSEKIGTFYQGEHTISICGDKDTCRYSLAVLDWQDFMQNIDSLGNAT